MAKKTEEEALLSKHTKQPREGQKNQKDDKKRSPQIAANA